MAESESESRGSPPGAKKEGVWSGAPERRLPARSPAGHKGTFGTVSVIGGCCSGASRMIGAPALAGLGALRAGCGLVRVFCPGPIIANVIGLCGCGAATGRVVETDSDGEMIATDATAAVDAASVSSTCMVIGPGLGTGSGSQAATLRALQQEEVAVVVDADAITCMDAIVEVRRDVHAAAVLTPHVGEFRRLARAAGFTDDAGLDAGGIAGREIAAERVAQSLGCVVVLKGKNTVVSDGQRTWVNPSGHACMATAGSGDVLSGVIAGIAAQFHALRAHPLFPATAGKDVDLFDCARIGVYAHGRAGEAWARSRGAEAGMLAAELADLIPAALQELRG